MIKLLFLIFPLLIQQDLNKVVIVSNCDYRSHIVFERDSNNFTKFHFDKLVIEVEVAGDSVCFVMRDQGIVLDILNCYYSNVFCDFIKEREKIITNPEFKYKFKELIEKSETEGYIKYIYN